MSRLSPSPPSSPPSPITQLIHLLHHQEPRPTQLEITILPDRMDDDNNNDNDYDDSDYYYLKDGIHLGIHAPNVPHLARSFRNEYYSLRKLYLRNYSNSATGAGGNANANANDEKEKEENNQLQLWEATTCLLMLCPDHATAWSDRKRILLQRANLIHISGNDNDDDDGMNCSDSSYSRLQDLWQQEIQYLNLLFTQHSKAYVKLKQKYLLIRFRNLLEVLVF